MKKQAECYLCEGTGKHKEPRNKELFDAEFDRLDKTGQFDMKYCREEALKESGYDEIECPRCSGTGNAV